MTRILLRGCGGRMGRMIADLAAQSDDCVIAAGVDLVECSAEFPVFTDLNDCSVPADVLVDFTRADGIEDSVAYALQKKMALLVGTTGLSQEQKDKLQDASQDIPVFLASNMSMGVALTGELSRYAASFLGSAFDVEIVETHHNQKLDAPSGTALTLAEAVRDGLGTPAPFTYGRQGRQPRVPGEIGIHALRGGTVTGTHEVNFFGHDETITLTHRAQSRGLFAAGAIRAAEFLCGKPAGWYTMADIVSGSRSEAEFTETDGFIAESEIPEASSFQQYTGSVWKSFSVSGPGKSAVLMILKDPSLDAGRTASILQALSGRGITPILAHAAEGEVMLAVEPLQREAAKACLLN